LNPKLNDQRDLSLPEAIRIAKALNRTLDQLFFDHGAPDMERRGRKTS
jgi:hypothetical protein